MTRIPRTMFAMVLIAAVTAVVSPAAQAAKGTSITATLTGTTAFPAVTGKAKFTHGAGKRELEVQIEHARPLAGRRLTVFVAGTKIGTMVVGKLGNAHLNRSTELGQAVPSVTAGSGASVRTAAGAIVAKGRF
jgi:hypothetical protein